MIYTAVCSALMLLRTALCQMTYLWIDLTGLSETSVSYQKFSINNGSLQVWGRLPTVRQTCAAADRRLESIEDVVVKVVKCVHVLFERARGAASQPPGLMTGNLISRRVEVFRVSDGVKLGRCTFSLEHKPRIGIILYPQYENILTEGRDVIDR